MSLIVNDSQQQEASNIRRAYKIAQNAVHKLKSPEHDLWSLSSRKARAALRDNVRRVLLSSPQEYGEMKLEVMAWQYGVHQVIARVKKEIKQRNNRAREFLDAQHGWYASFMHQLLDKLAKYGGAENIVFDWWTISDEETQKEEDTEEDKDKVQQILMMLCCKTLLCLGDICRYQHDLFPKNYSIKLSYRYYMQAWHMDPTSGMPWNNIGSLMQNNYHGVLSVFFYRRCLQSENPYVDCYKNLKHLFDKSKRAYAAYPRNQMDNIPIVASRNERKQAIYWLCTVFIHLNGLLRPATYCTERELNTCCRRLLDLLDLCLYFCDDLNDDEEEDDDKKPGFIKRSGLKVEGPSSLSNSSLVTVFAVLIQSFDDLRNQSSNRVGAANSLFVAAADFVIQHMISTIRDFEEGGGDKSESDLDDDIDDGIDNDNEKENQQPIEMDKSLVNRRRRNYTDSDLSEGSEEIYFEESEDEEEDESVYSQEHESEEESSTVQMSTRAISTQNANNNTNHPIIEEQDDSEETEEPHSGRKLACTFMRRHDELEEENEDEDEGDDDVINNENENDDGEMVFEFENDENEEAEDSSSSEVNISMVDIVNNFDKFVYMDVIKLICDWLIVNDDIIESNQNSPLWVRLAHLCNLLPISEMIETKGKENISSYIIKAMDQDSWMQQFSLWEDRFLYGIPIMGDVHDHIDFKATPPLTRWDENLLRLTSIRKFMKNLVDKFPQIDIKLLDGKFIAPSIDSLADDEFNIRGTFDEEQKSEQVVVVPTPEALANHLEAFKTISERGDCSIIVTNITVDGLDEMKTQSKEARDTTRWLETLLARCTGNIQSMAQPEQKSLQRLRRQDRQAWTLQHLINIGAKLQKQQRQVILLVNQVDGNLSPSVRKALASASANNLSIQTVDDYSRSSSS